MPKREEGKDSHRSISLNPQQTAEIAATMAPLLQPGDMVRLDGEMGAGKSTFARALIQTLCGPDTEVPSPTFTLVQTYETPQFSLWHFDLYRLEHPEEVYELGIEEAFQRGVSLIEWADRAGDLLSACPLIIEFEYGSTENERTLTFRDGNREDLRNNFLKAHGLKNEEAMAIPGDASRRRYFRLPEGVLMDAPPPHESTVSFERIGRLLDQVGLSVPQIYAVDHRQGFMLLEDLGDLSYRKAIAEGMDQSLLYTEIIKALTFLHETCSEDSVEIELPSYTLENFVTNASLFLEWAPFSFSADAKADFKALWEHAYLTQPPLPRVLLLRDVMIDNLFWLPERKGIKRCGFIDFQDASWGPAVYDLTSLLHDTRREALETCFVERMFETYLQAFPDLSRDHFLASYSLWGAQRTTRILGGVCFRQSKRDGRHQYMALVPRLSQILEQSLRHPTLHGLRLWFTAQGFIK